MVKQIAWWELRQKIKIWQTQPHRKAYKPEYLKIRDYQPTLENHEKLTNNLEEISPIEQLRKGKISILG